MIKPISKFALSCTPLAILVLSVSCSTANKVPGAVVPAQVHAGHPTGAELQSWRLMMLRAPKPGTCTVATYPQTQWQAIPCEKAPEVPRMPMPGIRHATVGGGFGGDWSAKAKNPSVYTAIGFFQSIQGVKSEKSKKNGTQNLYSLQLNTQLRCQKSPFVCYGFPTTACKKLGSPQPQTCGGWEQFTYSTYTNSGYLVPGVSMQYWLINFAPYPSSKNCPTVTVNGRYWSAFPNGNELDCWINSAQTGMPLYKATSLDTLTVYGLAAYPGYQNPDAAMVYDSDANKLYSVNGDNWFPDLYQRWQDAEFNVLGYGDGDEAMFNNGSTIVVRTQIIGGESQSTAPACYRQSFTGETNNLYLTKTPTKQPKLDFPSIALTETLPLNGKPPKSTSCVKEPGF